MRKGTAYFALLLVLVIAIAVLSIAIVRRRAPEVPEPTPTVVPTVAPPVEPTQLPTAAPVETEAPVQPTEPPVMETRPPIETPAPTPTPTPQPPKPNATGSIASNTGTGLNVKADWCIFDAGGTAKLQVDVSAMSYSLFTDALYQSVVLSVGGSTYSANSAAIRYDGDALTSTPIASFTLDAPASGTPLSLVWHYRGTYSGKALEDITAEGVIYY